MVGLLASVTPQYQLPCFDYTCEYVWLIDCEISQWTNLNKFTHFSLTATLQNFLVVESGIFLKKKYGTVIARSIDRLSTTVILLVEPMEHHPISEYHINIVSYFYSASVYLC